MITEAYVNATVRLDHEQIPVGMLTIYGFTEQHTEAVTGIAAARVKKIKEKLREKLGGFNSQNMGFHGQQSGYKIDGTLNDQDIFDSKQKKDNMVDRSCCNVSFPS